MQKAPSPSPIPVCSARSSGRRSSTSREAAILCVGSIEKQPAVITVDGTDTLAIRTRGMLSLAFDHRIVDGADADRFMADVKKTLEFPEAAI